jgi:hypothetical protein
MGAVVFVFGSEPSVWVWLAPVLAFAGSVLLFVGSLIGIW